MPPRREDRIFPLGGGRFRLVTTITHVSERVLTEDQLRELGFEPPAPEVPWTAEAKEDGSALRRRLTPSNVQPVSDAHRALDYWMSRLGALDERLPSQMPGWVRRFGIATVREAIDLVKQEMPFHGPGERYAMLSRVLRDIQRKRGGQ
jgi:hypothetical protein